MRRGLLLTTGLGLGVAAGCPRLTAYACAGNDDCDRAGQAGQCLPDGACAYPSDACDSGWVRSPNAAHDPGQCVPPSDGTGVGTTGPTPDDGASGMLDGTTVASTTGPTPDDTGPLPTCGWLVPFEVSTSFLSVSEVLEGYPLLVSLDDPALVAEIARSGDDLVVTDAAGDMLPHELELLDEAAGTLALWVRLPAYELGEPLPLQLRWGTGQESPDRTEVWADRYAGVWHMSDALSGIDGDEIRNSARIGEPGLTEGQMQPEQSVPAVVGRGLRFDGIDDMVRVEAEFVGRLESYAISLWVRYEGAEDGSGDFFQRLNGDYLYPRCWRLEAGSVYCQYIMDGDVRGMTGIPVAPGQLLHLTLMRDAAASTTYLYIDGEHDDTNVDLPGETLGSARNPFEIGHGEDGTLAGVIDEVRVSEAPLPASWIRADYRTQLEPAAVLGRVGEVQTVPCQ